MKKILFVDDEESIRDIMQLFFIGNQKSLLIAKNGSEALELIKKYQNQLSIILLDLMMPGIDGFDVLKHLKKHHINIPVIIQTGVLISADIQKVRSLGAKEVIHKPYSRNYLFQLIKKHQL